MIRKWLHDKRTSLELTQEAVAQRVGIERPYYTMIENGLRTPSVAVAQRIAQVLNFDWTLFFDNQGNETLLSSDEMAATKVG